MSDETSSERHESTVVPVHRPARPAAASRVGSPDRSRFMPLIVLAVILGVSGVVGVFFVLPGWIEGSVEDRDPVVEGPADVPETVEPGLSEEQIAALTARAESLLAELLEQQQDLEERAASSWGDTTWTAYETAARLADNAFLAEDVEEAVAQYESALDIGNALLARSVDILAEALAAGDQALAAGNAEHAASQYQLVLAVESDNARARAGLLRAGVLPDVLVAMRRGDALRDAGDLEGAASAYREAIGIDAEFRSARTALNEVEAEIAAGSFDRLLADGFSAIAARRNEQAAEHFAQALALRPDSDVARDGLDQAEQGELLDELAMAEVRARAFEQRERWDDAIARYREALAADPTISFAREGLARSQARADLDSKLQALIDTPRLLLTEEVFDDAGVLLAEARAIDQPGPRITEQTSRLARLIELASTPLPVTLISDGNTSVTIYRVGEIEPFMQTELELKPGQYTAIGHRVGYRDVRQSFSVLPGAANGPVTIICVEPI